MFRFRFGLSLLLASRVFVDLAFLIPSISAGGLPPPTLDRVGLGQDLSPAWYGPSASLSLISDTSLHQLLFSTFVESGKLFFSQCSVNECLECPCPRGDRTPLTDLFREFKNPNWPSLRATEIVRLRCGGVSVWLLVGLNRSGGEPSADTVLRFRL